MLKRFSLLVAVVLGIAVCSSLQAMQKAPPAEPPVKKCSTPEKALPPPCEKEKCCHFYVGPKAANLELQIRHNPNLAFPFADQSVKLDGPVFGAEIAYEYKKFRALYAGLLGSWVQGTITKDKFPSRFVIEFETEGRIGYNYMGMQGKKFVVTPYLGFGYNYISQKRKAATEVTYKYNILYLPVGFVVDYHLRRWLTIGFNFKWMPQVRSRLHISSISNVDIPLKKKSGQFLVEMPFIFRMGCKKRWDITITPYWERLKSGVSSRTVSGIPLGLPKQSYTYAGADLTFGYSF